MPAPKSISILAGQFKDTQVVEDVFVGVNGGVELRVDNELKPIEVIQAIKQLERYYQQYLAKTHPN